MKLDTPEKRRDPATLRKLALSAVSLLQCGGEIPDDVLSLIEDDLAGATLIARTIQNEREMEREEAEERKQPKFLGGAAGECAEWCARAELHTGSCER